MIENIKSKSLKNNIFLSLIVIALFLSASFYNPLSKNYIDNSLKSAALTYAVLRGLNAGVSVIQKSTLSVGVGIEGNIAVGEALDPINDAIERFSDLITISLWILGSEKALYEVSKTLPVLITAIILSFLLLFVDSVIVKKVLVLLVILRLFIPFSAAVSNYFNARLFDPHIQKDLQTLQFAKQEIAEVDIQKDNKKDFFSKIADSIKNGAKEYDKFKKTLDFYMKNSSKIVSSVIDLSLLYFGKYMINLILLPLLFVYLVKNISFEKRL